MVYTEKLEENLIELQNELIWKTYKVGRYRMFYVYEPKRRLIMALQFKDRVAQHAIYRQLKLIFPQEDGRNRVAVHGNGVISPGSVDFERTIGIFCNVAHFRRNATINQRQKDLIRIVQRNVKAFFDIFGGFFVEVVFCA